jgi:ribosomal-protein-alanine N-acetyltransferase
VQNCLHVSQALRCLLLDRLANHFTAVWVERPLSSHEDEPTGFHTLTMRLISIPTSYTDRLTLRGFSAADLDIYARRVFADPEVTRYQPQREIPPLERAVRSMRYFNRHWDEFGYGIWAVTDRQDGQLIGQCGLNYLAENGEVEVDYALARAYWGKGIATEAARAALDFGFYNNPPLQKIIALAAPENLASRRVMEHLGMTYTREADYFGMHLVWYEITRQAYLQRL